MYKNIAVAVKRSLLMIKQMRQAVVQNSWKQAVVKHRALCLLKKNYRSVQTSRATVMWRVIILSTIVLVHRQFCRKKNQ